MDKRTAVGLEMLMNSLADSVLESSDDAILAEVKQMDVNPHDEAERVRGMMHENLKILDGVHARLSHLGHIIDPKYWWSDEDGFYNNCLACGSLVSFTISNNDLQGSVFEERCRETGVYALRKYGNGNR